MRAPQPVADAVSALVNLGYGQPQAAAAIATATRSAGDDADTALLIRQGLKELAR
jgi:holliday junction DNA helicase RuvA